MPREHHLKINLLLNITRLNIIKTQNSLFIYVAFIYSNIELKI